MKTFASDFLHKTPVEHDVCATNVAQKVKSMANKRVFEKLAVDGNKSICTTKVLAVPATSGYAARG